MGEHRTYVGERPIGRDWRSRGFEAREVGAGDEKVTRVFAVGTAELSPTLRDVTRGLRGSEAGEAHSGTVFRGEVRRLERAHRRSEKRRARARERAREAASIPSLKPKPAP